MASGSAGSVARMVTLMLPSNSDLGMGQASFFSDLPPRWAVAAACWLPARCGNVPLRSQRSGTSLGNLRPVRLSQAGTNFTMRSSSDRYGWMGFARPGAGQSEGRAELQGHEPAGGGGVGVALHRDAARVDLAEHAAGDGPPPLEPGPDELDRLQRPRRITRCDRDAGVPGEPALWVVLEVPGGVRRVAGDWPQDGVGVDPAARVGGGVGWDLTVVDGEGGEAVGPVEGGRGGAG